MTKLELISHIAQEADITKAQAERMLDACLTAIENTLINEGKVTLTGFGSFHVKNRKATKGTNPRTGKKINIPPKRVIRFTPGKFLREAVK